MRIGIDLGGTKIEAVVLDDGGGIVFRERRATPRGDYDGTIEAIASLVAAAEAAVGARASVGIGMPGAISPATGLVKNANSTWLNGRPLDRDLSARLDRPVRLANDANCFALSEASDGAAAGAAVVFGVILGTGCGGGVVVHGRVLTGPNAIAGEWGHNPLPWPRHAELPGPECYCGKQGCLETFLSGPGLVRDYAAHADQGRCDLGRGGATAITAATVVARAVEGDAAAAEALISTTQTRTGQERFDAPALSAVTRRTRALVVGPACDDGPGQRVVAPLAGNAVAPLEDPASHDDAAAGPRTDDDAKH